MEIISVTNRKTQFHKSPSDLSVISSHEHVQGRPDRPNSSDLSFFMSKYSPKCFAQIYKSEPVIEIWRIKATQDGTEAFDRIRKIKLGEIQSISCSNHRESYPKFALGCTTGDIVVRELSEKNTIICEFKADANSRSRVVSLDHSSCGGYLSSVHENGLINIFGLTTNVNVQNVRIDRDPSLSRFCPSQRFHLAIADYKGGVTVFDLAAKRIHFQQKDAHSAPCRDIAMPEDIPDRLLSCGCDSLIKIFDTRQKVTGLQIKLSCGNSTISVSKCGGFFVVGNLKGEIFSYDMRSLNQPLANTKVDTDLVTRIAFMPTWGESESQLTTLQGNHSNGSALSDGLPDPQEAVHDFTMDDLVGFQQARISDFEINTVSRASSVTQRSDDARMSMNFGRNVKNAINDLSFDDSLKTPEREEHCSILDRIRRFSSGKKESLPKRRSSLMPSPLQRIHEEHIDKENRGGSLNKLSVGTPKSSGPRFSSTPALTSQLSKETSENKPELSNDVIDVDALDSSSEVTDVSSKKKTFETLIPSQSVSALQFNVDFKKEFDALNEKTDKINFQVQSLDMDTYSRHLEMMTYVFNQRRELQSRVQMIEECMGILMNDDVKINRIMELQDENRYLRHQLDETIKRLNR